MKFDILNSLRLKNIAAPSLLRDPTYIELYFSTVTMINVKNKIKKIIPLVIASRRIKYLGINLTKGG